MSTKITKERVDGVFSLSEDLFRPGVMTLRIEQGVSFRATEGSVEVDIPKMIWDAIRKHEITGEDWSDGESTPMIHCPDCGGLLDHAGTLEFCPGEVPCGFTRRLE